MEENKLTVRMGDDKNVVIDVIDIIKDENTNKEYIIYNYENKDDIYMSELEETEDTCTLKEITDEQIKADLEEFILNELSETGE